MRSRANLALIAAVAAILLGSLAAGPVAARDVGLLRWHRAAGSPSFEGALIESVAAGPRGVVAVGGKLSGGRFQAVAWTSTNGETWRPAVVSDPADVAFLSVTRWHDLFVAVGDVSVVRDGARTLDAVLYASRDGRRWTRLDTGSTFHSAQALNVASAGRQLVVSGCRGQVRFGCLFGISMHATIWTTSDGRSWRAATVGGATDTYVSAVTRTGNGLVAVGGVVDVEIDDEGFLESTPVAEAIWTSRDGRRWTRLEPSDPFDSSAADDVAWAAGRTVAVGSTFACPEVWATRRHEPWSTLEDPFALCGDLGALMHGVAAAHGLFVATGEFLTDSETANVRPGVWTSANGRDWAQDDDPGLAVRGLGIGSDVIPWRSGFLVAGFDGAVFGQDLRGAIWIGKPPA